MANLGNLEQQISNLQIGDEAAKAAKPGKKIGPAVPPKPKKSQPQVNPNLPNLKSYLFIYLYLSYILTRMLSYSHASLNMDAKTVTRSLYSINEDHPN